VNKLNKATALTSSGLDTVSNFLWWFTPQPNDKVANENANAPPVAKDNVTIAQSDSKPVVPDAGLVKTFLAMMN
jgi:hypothetical protein